MGVDYLSFGYATAVFIGGIAGYAKAGSVPSLIAGLVFGGLLGYGAYQTSRDPHNYYLSMGTALALLIMMGIRFYNSGKLMPAGMVALLSLGMVLRHTDNAINFKH